MILNLHFLIIFLVKTGTGGTGTGDSQSAKTYFFGMVENMSKLETKNGHEWGAIWSNRDEILPQDTSVIWSIFWGRGAGAWGLGRWEKIENDSFLGHFF